jgi:hypothetical protein
MTHTTDPFAQLRYDVELGTAAYRVDNGPNGVRTVDPNLGRIAWRTDTGEAIGMVGGKQTVIQPSETVEVFEHLLESGHIKERNLRAFAWKGGAKIAVIAETGKEAEIKTQRKVGEVIRQRIFSYDSFDGSAARTIGSADEVLICTNGMVRLDNQAVSRMRHTPSITQRNQEAVIALRQQFDSFEKQLPMLQRLADSKLNDRGFQAILDEWFPRDENNERTTRSQNQADKVERLYHTGAGADPGSLWGAYQAATNWLSHHRGRDATREEANLVGVGANQNRRILRDLVARAEAAAAL